MSIFREDGEEAESTPAHQGQGRGQDEGKLRGSEELGKSSDEWLLSYLKGEKVLHVVLTVRCMPINREIP